MRGSDVEIDHGASVIAPEVNLTTEDFGAHIVGAPANRTGTHACIAGGDGDASLMPLGGAGRAGTVSASFGGAVALSVAADAGAQGFIAGLDDGTLRRIDVDGATHVLRECAGQWIDNAVANPLTGLVACSAGRTVYVHDARGDAVGVFADHPSTPSGLCFSPDGRMLAVARYNGVTVWNLETGEQGQDLFWRGSHTAVSWSPDGTYIVTATQDRDLHCWRVADGRDYRMSGYPSKIRSISWTDDSEFVCASGADTVTAWYCGGEGPAGKPPIELGYVGVVTQVACHPGAALVAAGYDDGTVLIGDIGNGEAMIAKPAGGGMTTSLSWTSDGSTLVSGTAEGLVSTMVVTAPVPAGLAH